MRSITSYTTECISINSAENLLLIIPQSFFPLIPLLQVSDLLPRETSKFASKEEGVDTFQPSTLRSHHSCLDKSRADLPSSPVLPLLSHSSPSKNSSRKSMPFETGWICPFDLFSLASLPERVDSLSQGTSQPMSTEQCVQPPTSTAHGTISDCLPAAVPVVESNTALSQSNSCVPPSASTYSTDPELNDVVSALIDNESSVGECTETSDRMDPYIFDLLLQIPLMPPPQAQTTS